MLTLSEVKKISGEAGNFEIDILKHPRYVDMEKCIACGECAQKCPKKVSSEYDAGVGKRKAINVRYAQAVPLKYAIDAENCIYLTKGKCGVCAGICPTKAINYDDKPEKITVNAGAVLIAPGCSVYDPSLYDIYGYGSNPNVLTSLEFERILSATGPYDGHVLRPSDKKPPKKIAWLQCVGSRDNHNGARNYCSAVCCTYAIKETVVAKEHVGKDLDTAIFYIDMRTHGKDFERYYNRAKEEGVRFVKSRISKITPVGNTGNLSICYTDELGMRQEEIFDMVVLSVGFGESTSATELAQKLGIEMDEYNLAETGSFSPVHSSRPGIYVCGAFEAPKDIPQSVIESSACAAAAQSALSGARFSLTKTVEMPEETDFTGQTPRIGVFVCHCGTNIAGVVNVDEVADYARTLANVEHVEQNLFSCSQDTQDKITDVVREKKLNRVVVTACSPRTHEPLFQETVVNAGVNKYLFEMANIRNHCSWVHSADHAAATKKAKDLLTMSVRRVCLLEPLTAPEIQISPSALVIGGGISGMTAAKNLADQGYLTSLVERGSVLGGNALSLNETWLGEDIAGNLKTMVEEVVSHDRIDLYLNSELTAVDGFLGNFSSTVESNGEEKVIDHGVAIIATGASELAPAEYLYGEDPRVLTGLELEKRLLEAPPSLEKGGTTVFIQCVGSRIPERPYCSKVCCTQSVKNALKLKELDPDRQVMVLYRDMRTYGLREDLYTRAREKGVMFIRYDHEKGLDVKKEGDAIAVRLTSQSLGRELSIHPDTLVLASAVTPERDNPVAGLFKVPVNDDGFFVEAHVKLRPMDFATDGVFVCGLAHAPKPVDEAVAQGLGAASRAVSLISKGSMKGNAIVSRINDEICRGCRVCVPACPYQAISYDEQQDLCAVNAALCKGCGSCAAVCPTGAAGNKHFTDDEVLSMVESAFLD